MFDKTFRLVLAWQALRGDFDRRPDRQPATIVERVPVLGDPHLAKLYQVNVPDETGDYMESSEGRRWYYKYDPVYYSTCEQAHGEHPDKSVSEVKAIRIGTTYFVGDLKAIKTQPKPKRPKGKA